MLRRLLNGLIWLLVAGSVAIILGGLLGRPVLVAAVPTTSMVPVLRPGDLIPVLPLFGTTPQRGEIVVYRTPQDATWIVHRIVGGDLEEGFITQGDANPIPDPHRVHVSDIAGFVPQVGHGALRVPNVGAISLARSPVSNPIVAAAALLVGVYLLLADSGAGIARMRRIRMHTPRKFEINPSQATSVYIGLAVILSVMTFMTSWSLLGHEVARYKVVPTRSTSVFDLKVSALHEERTDKVAVKNISWVPVIVGLSSSDADMQWDQEWFLLAPKSQRTVALHRSSGSLGEHVVTLRQAYYVPFLPTSVLQALAKINWYLPIFAVSIVPMVPLLALASADRKVNRFVRNFWSRLKLRLRV